MAVAPVVVSGSSVWRDKDRSRSASSDMSSISTFWMSGAVFGDVVGESVGDGVGVFFLFFFVLVTSVHSALSLGSLGWVPRSLLSKNCFSSYSMSVARSRSGS